jgi:hypothetical protein
VAAVYEQKMKEAQKRVEKLRRVVGIASENLEAFDEDLGLHGDNIGRLTKLRDELKNHVAQTLPSFWRTPASSAGKKLRV